MTNILRSLPAVAVVFALAGSVSTAHAEDTVSPSPSTASSEAPTNSVDVSVSMGSGGVSAKNDLGFDGFSMGLSALYYGKSGHGFGLRGTASTDHFVFNGLDMGTVDAVYAYRPWQAHGTFALVPSVFAGPGYMSVTRNDTDWWNGGPERITRASAFTMMAGAALDLHIAKYFVVGVEGSGRVALAGNDDLRGSVGWNGLVHLGGEMNF